MIDCNSIKRYLLLTIIFPFIRLIPYDLFDFARTIYYTSITTAISSYVILVNFPKIIKSIHSRPLYFNDLDDTFDYPNHQENPNNQENKIDQVTQKKFQSIFIVTLQFFGAIMVTAMVDYYLYRYRATKLSGIEIFGILGGFISLLTKIERIIGKILLTILSYMKNKPTNLSTEPTRVSIALRRLSRSLSGLDNDIIDNDIIDNDIFNNIESEVVV